MRVLILTHICWPEGADYKNLSLANGLVAQGHEVTVLTAFPNHPLGRLYEGYKLRWRQWEYLNGVRILRVPLYPDHSSSGLKRIINYLSFTLSASTIGLLLSGRMDVIFVHSPPMTLGLAAGLFKLFYKAPILLDVVDLWPDAILGSGMVSSKVLVNGAGWIARLAYRLADKITVPTDGFAERLVSAGVLKEKTSVMPHWADGALFDGAQRDEEFGARHALQGKFCIIHGGNVGPFQDIENILSAAERVRDLESLRIVFVGGGRDLEEMRKIKDDRNLHNVIFAGSYPPEAMAGIFAWGDALLVSLLPGPYLDINLPSKVSAYMAAGRPILANAGGETARLIEENSLGFTCRPGNPDLLAETFKICLDSSSAERHEMGLRARQHFDQNFARDLLVDKYVAMLQNMTGSPAETVALKEL